MFCAMRWLYSLPVHQLRAPLQAFQSSAQLPGWFGVAHGTVQLAAAQQVTACSYSNFASWLTAPFGRWLKKRLRGQAIFPALPLRPGDLSPRRAVPPHISRPHYVNLRPPSPSDGSSGSNGPPMSKQPEFMVDETSRSAMRAVGRLAAAALRLAGTLAVPGTTTDQIDAAVHEFLISQGAYPSPLMYHSFPKSICTSVNEVVCHGVPDSRPLQDGDLLNIDVTAYLDGFHGDTNATFCVGTPSAAAQELVQVTEASLQAAIDVCGPGVPFKAIGDVISRVADQAGMYVIKDFVGHGIGKQFHGAPAVLHHRNMRPGSMQPWQTFTIEPILALGTWQQRPWPLDPTGWTCVTSDGSWAAQFEHTIMVTQSSAEVLTR